MRKTDGSRITNNSSNLISPQMALNRASLFVSFQQTVKSRRSGLYSLLTHPRSGSYSAYDMIFIAFSINLTHLTKIMKWIVDHLEEKMPFPLCQLAIKWRGEDRQVFPDVSRCVDLVGAKHPYNKFFIQLPEQNPVPLPSAQGQ